MEYCVKIDNSNLKCAKCNKDIKILDKYYKTTLQQFYGGLPFQENYEIIICEKCYQQFFINEMTKYGISVIDENGNWKNFEDILKELEDIWDYIKEV